MSPSRVGHSKTFPTTPLLIQSVVNCIGNVKPPKKAGRPVTIELNPNFDILAQMRTLQITFLDHEG